MVLSTEARATISGCMDVWCLAGPTSLGGVPGSLRLNAGGGS